MERFGVNVHKGPVEHGSRIVDHDVEPPETADRRVDQDSDVVGVLHPHGNSKARATERQNLLDVLFAGLDLAAGDDHCRAGLGQAEGDRPSEAPRPTRHDRHTAGQVEQTVQVGMHLRSPPHPRLRLSTARGKARPATSSRRPIPAGLRLDPRLPLDYDDAHRSRVLPSRLPRHLRVGSDRRGWPGGAAARQPRASVLPRRAMPEGQPLSQAGQRR